jgi:putative transferase (TIGR04331 family)
LYKNNFKRKKYHIVKDFWENRNKLLQIHNEAKVLHEIVLRKLHKKLNQIHNTKYGLKTWRFILDPWLVAYISVVSDRFERIKNAASENNGLKLTCYLSRQKSNDNPARNYLDFIDKVTSDNWNQVLMQDIIEKYFQEQIKIIHVEKENDSKLSLCKKKTHFKKYILSAASLVAKISRYFQANNKYFFYKSYFSIKKFIKLNFYLNQFPFWSDGLFVLNKKYQKNESLRFQSRLCVKTENARLKFIMNRIFQDIPQIYLEDFNEIRISAEKCPIRPKIILSALGHWINDYFKIWVIAKKKLGAKYYALEHGGSFPPQFDTMEYEDRICDRRIVWAEKQNSIQTQLPPNKINLTTRKVNKEQFLLIIPWEMQRYPVYLTAAPGPSARFFSVNKVNEIMHKLPRSIFESTRIKPYPSLNNFGYNQDKILLRKYPNQMVKSSNLYDSFQTAKTIVSLYPNTTFSEAMSSGKPSILFFSPDQWEINKKFQNLVESLAEQKIIHFNLKTFIKHLQDIWSSPNDWWNMEETKKVRINFHKRCCNFNSNTEADWAKFLKKKV